MSSDEVMKFSIRCWDLEARSFAQFFCILLSSSLFILFVSFQLGRDVVATHLLVLYFVKQKNHCISLNFYFGVILFCTTVLYLWLAVALIFLLLLWITMVSSGSLMEYVVGVNILMYGVCCRC